MGKMQKSEGIIRERSIGVRIPCTGRGDTGYLQPIEAFYNRTRWHPTLGYDSPPSAKEQGKGQWPTPTIQEAQTGLVDFTGRIFPGSHTGTLWFEYRYNDCHFLDEGFDEAARLWLNALTHQPVVATS